jgi:hypothetical protein
MSGGGGTPSRQTQVSEPWSGVQPFLRQNYGNAAYLAGQAPQYFPGETTVGPTQSEGNAWNSIFGYNNDVFGGAQSPQFGAATGALNSSLSGQNALGQMAGGLAPGATGAVQGAFSPYDIGGRFDQLQGPGGSIRNPAAQAGQIGQYGFGTSLNPNQFAPQFGQAGSLDATSAYQRMLSGQPDYQGAQGAIDAANAPILRQLNEQIIPGLNERATFTNNMTGGIKGLNSALPQVAQRMGENAQNIMNQERVRALDQQERAAGAVAQGGFQGYGLGLNTAMGQRGLEQNLANLGLSADQARAGFGLQDQQMGLQTDLARMGLSQNQAQFGLQREQAREAAMGGYRGDVLGYGNLAGQLGAQSAQDQARAISMFPSIYDTGRAGGQDALSYANYDRALQEDQLGSQIDRFNYMRDEPFNRQQWLSQILAGAPGGSTTITANNPSGSGSRVAGALGGALGGAGAAGGLMSAGVMNAWNPWGWALMGAGALGGYLGG